MGTDVVIRLFSIKSNNIKVKEMVLSQCPSGGFENYWEY